MSKHTCQETEEALVLSATGEPMPEQLIRHMEECGACRQEFKRLQSMVHLLQKAAGPASAALPADLHARLMNRLRRESAPRRETPRFSAWVEVLCRVPRRWAWGTFALGIVAVAAALVLRNLEPARRQPSETIAKGVGSVAEAQLSAQPAGPVELRRALAHSFDDFEEALRRNDRLLAARDPFAVPLRPRATLRY